ncbi:shikimate kinase, partial [Escherichia coli]|uniref:shikimate kinase n=1 Tax=Escherichia coli TaxID=562 RepID=UPI0027D2E65D
MFLHVCNLLIFNIIIYEIKKSYRKNRKIIFFTNKLNFYDYFCCLNQYGDMKIFILGFMGNGKTTVGRRLAEVLGYRFIDLDEEI